MYLPPPAQMEAAAIVLQHSLYLNHQQGRLSLVQLVVTATGHLQAQLLRESQHKNRLHQLLRVPMVLERDARNLPFLLAPEYRPLEFHALMVLELHVLVCLLRL